MTATVTKIIKHGEVWWTDLGVRTDSIQGGVRPVLIVSNDKNNQYSPNVTIVPLTTKSKRNLPTHVTLDQKDFLNEVSIALVEQITTISKEGVIKYMGKANDEIMIEIDKAIGIQTASQKQFSYNLAFDMIKQISNIKLEINELGKRPRLIDAYNSGVANFKTYCSEYNKNYKIILNEYKEGKIRTAI